MRIIPVFIIYKIEIMQQAEPPKKRSAGNTREK